MALINKIIPFSCVDGPGNRMVIFFQGCNFQCLYCHNPETINKCISCGKCVENCEVGALSISEGKVIWDEEECISCDKCIKLCENMSSSKTKEYSVEELVKKIEKDSFFIRGITVSGGECTLNSEFLINLFREVKKLGLTCFVDTNGNTKLDDELINLTDKFMLDVKSIDEKENIWLTKSSNKLVLENLKRILELDKMYEVRTVIAKGLNSEKTVDEVSKIIGDKCRYKLIKYRPFGVREEGIKVHGTISPEDSYMNKLKEKSIANGCIDTIITIFIRIRG
ncbi:MAG: YjjW family glycine radical enzyme activase [Clostridium perfringens]